MKRAARALLAASTAALAVAALTVTSPAGAAESSTISGVITQGADGSAATNVCALLYKATSTEDLTSPQATACSDSTGHYTLDDVPPGQYVVWFVDGDTTRHDVPQFWNGKKTADTASIVTVSAGSTTENVNARMSSGAYATGVITDATSNKPVSDVCVRVYASPDSSSVAPLASADGVGYAACTDENGRYVTGAFPAGEEYTIAFNTTSYGSTDDQNYVGQWYDGAARQSDAKVVTPVAGAYTADASLARGQTVTGTVTGDGTAPVDSVYASFQDADTGDYAASVYLDDKGMFTAVVPPGSYIVEFNDYNRGYARQWYKNAATRDDATPVIVTADAPVTDIDAQLTGLSGGSISGTVQTKTGAPVPGFNVRACSDEGDCGYATTAKDGSYTITNLAAAAYTVRFSGDQYGYYDPDTGAFSRTAQYLRQIYPDMVDDGTADGSVVEVAVGKDTPDIDDTVVAGTTFSGTVTDAQTGAPLSDVCVAAQPKNGEDEPLGYYSDDYCTDSDGRYTTNGVPAGDYLLRFRNYRGRYIRSWYADSLTEAGATALTATSTAEDVAGKNQKMQLGGRLAGRVIDSEGNRLSDVCVSLYEPTDTVHAVSQSCTDANGEYTSDAVAAGRYIVQFVDYSGNYSSSFYKNATSADDATPVTVTTGDTTTDVDATLTGATEPGAPTGVTARGGNRSATVTFSAPDSDGGSPITGYDIIPSPACDACEGTFTESGSATVTGLTNGTSYTFTVKANNAVGSGPASAPSNAVTPAQPAPPGPTGPTLTVPDAPTNVGAVENVSKVQVSWAAPANDGNSPITSYTVTPSPACTACTGLTTSSTSTTVEGLTAGTRYTFTVTATNAVGTGAPSVTSPPATPVATAQSPVSASSSDPAKPASVTGGGTTATASGGTGTVTVAQYPSNPAATPTFTPSGAYLDVNLSSGSTFASVVVRDCNLRGGTTLYWWNPAAGSGGAWAPVVGNPTDTSKLPGCLTVTLDDRSSPTVDQLGGTIFAAALPDQPTVKATSLTATVARSTTYGAALTVKGRLTRSDTGNGVGGRSVRLQYRRHGTKAAFATYSRSATTTATGAVTFARFAPRYSVDVRLRFTGNATLGASTSRAHAVVQRARVGLATVRSVASKGSKATFSGSVVPVKKGHLVALQRLAGRRWVTLARQHLSARSAFRFAYSMRYRGSFVYRVLLPGDGYQVTTASRSVRVRTR